MVLGCWCGVVPEDLRDPLELDYGEVVVGDEPVDNAVAWVEGDQFVLEYDREGVRYRVTYMVEVE